MNNPSQSTPTSDFDIKISVDDHETVKVSIDEMDASRSKSTMRLQLQPNPEQHPSYQSIPALDDQHLHTIVGHHLALATLPETNQAIPIPTPTSLLPTAVQTNDNPFEFSKDSQLCTKVKSIRSKNSSNASTSSGSSNTLDSHFQLQGGADTSDIYKWHEKQSRPLLGSRSHTYHAPQKEDPEISAMKSPGGFRRHYVKQDAESRGEPSPKIKTDSFIHFLGLFSMYEIDHFAGEDFSASRRQSIVSQMDKEKKRFSRMESSTIKLSIYEDEAAIDNDSVKVAEEKISFSQAVNMLFKTFIASGILFLPNAFKNGGILFAPLFMTLIAVLCLHSFLLLVQCRELHPGSYGDIGQHFYGRWMRYIVLFAIAISQFGFCWLGFSALFADICIIVGLIYLYVYDIKELVINHGSPTPLRLFNSNDFGIFVGTAVFSYEGIGMVIPICSSMANPKQFPRALTLVLTVVCTLLVSFGSLGYAAYGDSVQTIVLDNLPQEAGGEKAGKSAIQLLYVIAVFLTTPLMLFPCIRIFENLVFSVVKDESSGKVRMMKENAVRIVIDFAVATVAYAGYHKLDIFISFVGSFACAPLLFIFPPLFHLRAFPGQPLWRKISSIVLILFGFAVFFYTLVITIQNF
ncbi:neutral amino acid transporter [Entomortierella beljakovae]|nr:neutral amino acid transporter [Entomortierella beljakovae]